MQIQNRIKHLLVTMLGALVIAGCSSTATEPVVEEQARDGSCGGGRSC